VIDIPELGPEGTSVSGTESDVPNDPHVANTRRTGGRQTDGEQDKHSTTGTTESGEFVGRVTGEDAGDGQESGAEKRAQAR
jgi:hypothetical protein